MRKPIKWAGLWLLLPSLAGVMVFYIAPLFLSLYFALTQGISQVRFVGLENFRALLGNPVFLSALRNTVEFLLIAVPLAIVLALALSMIAVKDKFTWQRWALLLPMVIPASSLCAAWEGLWGPNGLVNEALAALCLEEADFLRGDGAFWMLIGLYLLKNTGYLSVILSSAIRAVPAEYQEAYRLDSSSEAGFARDILLPLLSPTVLFCAVAAVMNYFLLFRDTYVLYQDNPPEQLYMLQHFMNSNFFKLNYQRLSCAAFLTVLFLLVLIVLVLLAQRRVKQYVE